MICEPPRSKIPNYEFRFAKVMKDAAWHVLAIKNCNNPKSTRYRRDISPSIEIPIADNFSMSFERDYQNFIVAFLSDPSPSPFEFHPKLALTEDEPIIQVRSKNFIPKFEVYLSLVSQYLDYGNAVGIV